MAHEHVRHYSSGVPLPVADHQSLLPYSPSDTPTFIQTPVDSFPNLLAAQEKASRKRVVGKTALIAVGIFVCTVGMIFAFLSYICVFHQCQASRSSIISTAPLGRVLTISQVTSHVAPLSIPIVMSILSNLASARWLKSSVNNGPNRPSPMQLGLLMSMYDGAGISSLVSSIKYILKRRNGVQKITLPPILRQCIVLLGSLLAITYLTAAADSWLHASSTSVVITNSSPYSSSILANFGREINATMCAQTAQDAQSGDRGSVNASQIYAASCGLNTAGTGGTGAYFSEGLRVVANTSATHRVVLSDDQIALVVPVTFPGNISYSAQTLGVRSQCVSITQECIVPPQELAGLPFYGPNAQLNLNCSQGGLKYVAGVGQSPLCPLDNEIGNCTNGVAIESNPFNTGEIITSMAYLEDGVTQADQFINNTGWFVHGNNGAWNVVYCNVTVLSVNYKYEASRYITQSYYTQPLTIARYIMSASFQYLGSMTSVSTTVQGAGYHSNTTFEEAYSNELSRQTLARAAHIYEPQMVFQIQSENNVDGSKLQVIPLAFFVGALGLFLCEVLFIAINTIVETRGVPYVGLAARHLSNPLTAMQRLYGHPRPELSWEMDSEKGFGPETDYDRLRVGPVTVANGGASSSVFMVGKGQKM